MWGKTIPYTMSGGYFSHAGIRGSENVPRPLIGNARSKIDPITTNPDVRIKNSLNSDQLRTILKKPRSQKYIDNITKLDAGGVVSHKTEIDSIIDCIKQELPELSIEQFPIGIVARCYLGPPFEVHTLDFSGNIIQHYETYKPLPESLEKARSLSLHPKYIFVEVYQNGELRAVSKDGSVTLVGGE